MASSNPTFGAIYGLSKMDSPTDLTPMINGGIRATSIANAYGQDLAIQRGAPLLGNNFDNTKNALSGGPSVSIGAGTHKSETTWTESYISQFNMGSGSMTVKSGRDINLVGTQIQAEGITLDAGRQLNVLADADYYKNRSSGNGVSVSYGTSGWGFGVSGNHSKTDSTTYTNAWLNAGGGNLVLKSGAEMNIIGANLDGKFIDVDAKGLLTVASVQNTSHSKNSSFGINVNQSNATSINGSKGSSDRSFTDNLTTILGTEGVRIHSDTGTVVEGALIANATKNADGTLTDHGNLTIETPMLAWKDLEDIDVSKQVGGGINVSGDDGRSTSGTKTFSDVWDDTANIDYRKDETIGVTKATIGNGTINITNPSQQTQDLTTLNRDINNVQIITKESETHISITVPVPDSIANPIGNAGGAVANGIVDTTAAAAEAASKIAKNLAEMLEGKGDGELGQKMAGIMNVSTLSVEAKEAASKLGLEAVTDPALRAQLVAAFGSGDCVASNSWTDWFVAPAYAGGCNIYIEKDGQQIKLSQEELGMAWAVYKICETSDAAGNSIIKIKQEGVAYATENYPLTSGIVGALAGGLGTAIGYAGEEIANALNTVVPGGEYVVKGVDAAGNYIVENTTTGQRELVSTAALVGGGALAATRAVKVAGAAEVVGGAGTRAAASWTYWGDYPKVMVNGKEYAKIGDYLYTQHAVENMYPKGLGEIPGHTSNHLPTGVPASVVNDVLTSKQTTVVSSVRNGVERTVHTLGDVNVVKEGNVVVTVIVKK